MPARSRPPREEGSDGGEAKPKCERRTLARPLVQGGVHKAPGETVELRPDQIARLEAQGYFAAAQEARRAVAPEGAQKDNPTGTPESTAAGGEGDDEGTAQ